MAARASRSSGASHGLISADDKPGLALVLRSQQSYRPARRKPRGRPCAYRKAGLTRREGGTKWNRGVGGRRGGGPHVFGDDPIHQGDGQALLPRGPLLAGGQSLRLGLSRPHREPGPGDGAAAPPPLAHHRRASAACRRCAGPASSASSRCWRRARAFEYTSGTPLSTPSGIMVGSYEMETRRRRELRRRHPGLLARQPAPAGPPELTGSKSDRIP